MKTTEQIKNEVLDYLQKTAMHTFVLPNKKYFAIRNVTEKTYDVLENDNVTQKQISVMIDFYQGNAKNVIKHRLFLDKGAISIKQTKFVKHAIEELFDAALIKKGA